MSLRGNVVWIYLTVFFIFQFGSAGAAARNSEMAAESARTALRLSVTDSLNSTTQEGLGIKIASATQVFESSSTAPSQYYGSGIGSDGLANTTVGPSGNMVSYRFLA